MAKLFFFFARWIVFWMLLIVVLLLILPNQINKIFGLQIAIASIQLLCTLFVAIPIVFPVYCILKFSREILVLQAGLVHAYYAAGYLPESQYPNNLIEMKLGIFDYAKRIIADDEFWDGLAIPTDDQFRHRYEMGGLPEGYPYDGVKCRVQTFPLSTIRPLIKKTIDRYW